MPKMSSTQKNPNLADMEVRVVSEYIWLFELSVFSFLLDTSS